MRGGRGETWQLECRSPRKQCGRFHAEHSYAQQADADAHNTYKTFTVPILTVACHELELRGADGLVRGGERKSVELDRD